MDFFDFIPQELIYFIEVLIFSLVIGLEQRRHHSGEDESLLFGTDRTFTFIGLLGYILFIADPNSFFPFITGFVITGLLLGIHYFQKISQNNNYGLTSTILALLTYCLPVMVFTQPGWLVLFFVVVLLILTEMKSSLIDLTKKASEEEFITLAVFIALSGVILPLLPNENISEQIPVSPYKIWLSIVVVSGISYVSYLLKKFVFPDSGVYLTGILGGLYSSTATTLILARREKQGTAQGVIPAIMIANGMMYLRILFLAFIFNKAVAILLLVSFLIMFGICAILSKLLDRSHSKDKDPERKAIEKNGEKNPLELKTAAVFGLLFVIFGLATHYVFQNYGNEGITGLSFVAGITDIDPFLLNLLQQKEAMSQMTLLLAFINATNSNNLMKLVYAYSLSSKEIHKKLIIGFSTLIASGILISIFYYLK